MKHEQYFVMFLLAGILALMAVATLVIWRLTLDMLFTLVMILVAAVAIAIISIGVAFIVRANRSGGPRTRELVRETQKVHTIDGRQPASPPVVIAGNQSALPPFFPHLLRAAYQTGENDGHQHSVTVDGQPGDSSLEVGWPEEEWDGEIIDADVTTQS